MAEGCSGKKVQQLNFMETLKSEKMLSLIQNKVTAT